MISPWNMAVLIGVGVLVLGTIAGLAMFVFFTLWDANNWGPAYARRDWDRSPQPGIVDTGRDLVRMLAGIAVAIALLGLLCGATWMLMVSSI